MSGADGGALTSQVVSLRDLPTWPLPPPSPPSLPPHPPPERHLNITDAQLECQFEQGIDLAVSTGSSEKAATNVARAVDTQMQCCALCAMRNSCERFVFIPDTGACVLLPHVSKLMLVRISNPATVAGTVFVAHGVQDAPVRSHAKCAYEVGYGYANGALGAGRPIDGPRVISQQDCCDACDRNPECVKFVYERFGGSCQLFESFAERYHTPGLISGKVEARVALGYGSSLDAQADEGNSLSQQPRLFLAPPTPPSFATAVFAPPPVPPPGEGVAAQAVLKYASLTMGVIIVFGILLCGYCFYFGEIQGMLHRWSRGRLGQAQFSLLPKSLREVSRPDHGSRRRRGKKPQLLTNKGTSSGHVAVTCATSHVTQKKYLALGQCRTLDELLNLIWDEFGHLLKHLKAKDVLLLCQDTDHEAGHLCVVTSASDMGKVVSSTALKVSEKSSSVQYEVAFPAVRSAPAAKKIQYVVPTGEVEETSQRRYTNEVAELGQSMPLSEEAGGESKGRVTAGVPFDVAACAGYIEVPAMPPPPTADKGGAEIQATPPRHCLKNEGMCGGLDAPTSTKYDPDSIEAVAAVVMATKARQGHGSEPDDSVMQISASASLQDQPRSVTQAALRNQVESQWSDEDEPAEVHELINDHTLLTFSHKQKPVQQRQAAPRFVAKAVDDGTTPDIIDVTAMLANPMQRPVLRNEAANTSPGAATNAAAHDTETGAARSLSSVNPCPILLLSQSSHTATEPAPAPVQHRAPLPTRMPPALDTSIESGFTLLAQEQRKAMVGQTVEIHQLKGNTELNGRTGVIATYDPVKDRFKVRLHYSDTDGTPKVLSFKPVNVRAMDRDGPCDRL